MSRTFDTPQDAEDAYYDALEEGDLEKLLTVWDDASDIGCLLPMHPLAQGRPAVRETFSRLFGRGRGIALSVKHLSWIETGDVAIHLVEEAPQSQAPGGSPPWPCMAPISTAEGPTAGVSSSTRTPRRLPQPAGCRRWAGENRPRTESRLPVMGMTVRFAHYPAG